MQWLQDVFIPYLDKWESSVKARPCRNFLLKIRQGQDAAKCGDQAGTENDRYSCM